MTVQKPAPAGQVARQSLFEYVASLLGAAVVDDEARTVRGSFEGRPVAFALTLWTEGSLSGEVTEVGVPMPAGLRRNVFVVQRRSETLDADVQRGLLVPITFDDGPFDHAYLVSGAPERLVRALLDAPARAAILALQLDGVVTWQDGFLLRRSVWIDDAAWARAAIELVVRIAESAARFVGDDEDAVRLGRLVSYRDVEGGPPSRHVRDDAELDHHQALSATRRAHHRRTGVIVLASAIGVLALLGLLVLLLARRG